MGRKPGDEAPRARTEELIVRELPDEVLVYDLRTHKAHCLNQTAALVWKHCDGSKSVPDIAQELRREFKMVKVDEDSVWYVLDTLRKARLLEEGMTLPPNVKALSRREALRKLAVAAGVGLPLVASIVAPSAAQAASVVPKGGCAAFACQSPQTCISQPCTRQNGAIGKCECNNNTCCCAASSGTSDPGCGQ